MQKNMVFQLNNYESKRVHEMIRTDEWFPEPAKDTWSISLTRREWQDMMAILRQHDKAVAETIVEQIAQQMEGKLK